MKLTLTIRTDNAAFDPPEAEVARILREYADLVSRDQIQPKVLRDINGNQVGTVTVR